MGAHASTRAALCPELQDPLLAPGYWAPGTAGGRPSAPPSFKAQRPRKTRDFIGSERELREARNRVVAGLEALSRPSWEHPAEVDDRLIDDSADAHTITARVASLIYRYVEEGDAALGRRHGPRYDDFHEAHFVRRHWCECLRGKRPQTPTPEDIFSFIGDVSASLYFCKQVVVLCAVYIERLLQQTNTVLTTGNWRSIVIVSFLVASKVWEDVHPWNADFEDCLKEVAGIRFKRNALYRLEAIYLEKVSWRVVIDGELYAAYYFGLLEGGSRLSSLARARPRAPHKRMHSDSFMFDTIIEEEDYINNDRDQERGTFVTDTPQSGENHSPSSPSSASSSFVLPWSREELVSYWRRGLLEDSTGEKVDASGFAHRAMRDAWKLDANNPLVGALRHAPRALPPSSHIPHSEDLLWMHKLASQTSDMLGPKSVRNNSNGHIGDPSAAHTLSGATGVLLASELRRFLDGRREGGLALGADGDNLV